MTNPAREFQLGGESLGENRHVCGLFEGAEAAWDVVLPFIGEGLRQGERVVYLTGEPEALTDRLRGTVDVDRAVASGQLALTAWTDSYLVEGGFSADRMIGTLRSALREGSDQGFAVTRLVGEMEWAQEGVRGVEELIAYEVGVDTILGRPPHAALCVYDVRRHSASRIAAVLGAHHAAFVGGRLQRTDDASRGTRPRDRIMAAASLLFSQAGVRAVGVDALIKEARVAKATFYRHFPSKDRLIVAWLEDPRTRWLETVRARAESRATSAQDVIPQFFSAVAEWLEAGDFRGCPYLNTSMELTDPAHRATAAIRSYLDEVQAYLAQALTAAGYRDVAILAPALQSLVAGAITLGVAHRSQSFVVAAREAAIRLLENAPRT